MNRFKAEAVSALEMPDLACFVVALAEASDGSGARLEIQRAASFDEQDIALGMNTYCLCNEAGGTCYGGILSWRIDGSTLRIYLDAAAEGALDAPGGYAIELAASPDAQDSLVSGMHRVLDSAN